MIKSDITSALAHALFNYDASSGMLRGKGIKFKETIIDGYRSVSLGGITMYVHQLIWLLETGDLNTEGIKHINGNLLDNRWINLYKALPTSKPIVTRAAPSKKKVVKRKKRKPNKVRTEA